MLSGHWIRFGKCTRAKSLIVVFSLACSVVFLEWHQIQVSERTKQMFVGVNSGDINTVKEQLDNGADVNVVNETGETALHVVQSKNIARLLIDHGANANAKDDSKMTPLFNKDIEIAGLLLDAGADINAKDKKGNTAFIWYTYSGYLEGLKFLISRGAEVNVCNVDKQNAMDIAKHFHPHTNVEKYMHTLNIPKCNE